MVLPVTLELHEDEAPISLVARLAAANGFSSLRAFLAHTEVTAAAIVRGEPEALSAVSEWSGISSEKLGVLASESGGVGQSWRLGKATLNKEMRPGRLLRFCANCVLDDREYRCGRIVSRAYHRAWWSVRGIEGCHVHDRRLTEVAIPAGGDPHDFPRFVDANIESIRETTAAVAASSQPQLDHYLADRIFQWGGTSFLDSIEAHVVAEFSRYLGDFLSLHQVDEFMDDGIDSREWGFRLAAQGEEEIRRVIAAVIHQKRPKAKYFEPFLGPMVTWFRRNIEKPAYQSVIDLVQDILERNMPFGEGQVILKPVQARYVYCVNSAHAEYGMSKDRIRALMKSNDPAFRDGLSDASTYFDAAALRPILEAANETLTSKEAGAALGLQEARVHDLLKSGALVQVETRAGDERTYTRIRKADVDALIHRLTVSMAAVTSDNGMLSLSAAARSWRCPFYRLVSKILDESLEAFVMPGNEPVLQRARVKPGSLQLDTDRLMVDDDELMRLKDVERAVGTTTATIAELVEHGYLRLQIQRRETGRSVKFVSRRSLTDFEERYISLSAIAKKRNGFRAAIKSELDKLGITPIYEPTGFNARFYRRSDLARTMVVV